MGSNMIDDILQESIPKALLTYITPTIGSHKPGDSLISLVRAAALASLFDLKHAYVKYIAVR
jgi:hypothetical protein